MPSYLKPSIILVVIMESSLGILTIDLAAIQMNWKRINCQLDAGKTSSAAVIKANAYGLGAAQVGRALYDAGCREFFLATQTEAVEARTYLPADAVLYVLGGMRSGVEQEFIRNRLVPVLFSLKDLRRWQSACERAGVSGDCAVKVNTGMTRLGLDMPELLIWLSSLSSFSNMRPVLIMSHLACADEPGHPLNKTQLNEFRQVVKLCKPQLPDARFSLANSSAIFLGKEWHFDLVRPGASLYGINPQQPRSSPVLPVIQLDLPVIQVRKILQSASVGYCATTHVAPSSVLAVVAGGYADGLHRTIGSQGRGNIDGYPVNIIGRISMDTSIFDVSSVPDEILQREPLMVKVLGGGLTLDLMMEQKGVLGYEILTSLGVRYQRRYVSDGRLNE